MLVLQLFNFQYIEFKYFIEQLSKHYSMVSFDQFARITLI